MRRIFKKSVLLDERQCGVREPRSESPWRAACARFKYSRARGAADLARSQPAGGAGRWDARDKALVFGSWPTLEAVLRAILERQVKGDEQA